MQGCSWLRAPLELKEGSSVTGNAPSQPRRPLRLLSAAQRSPSVLSSLHAQTQETASLLERTAGLCLPLGASTCRKLEYVHIETGEVSSHGPQQAWAQGCAEQYSTVQHCSVRESSFSVRKLSSPSTGLGSINRSLLEETSSTRPC